MATTQVSAEHYEFLGYETAERYSSYWHQINSILGLAPNEVLEIGVGSGLTKHVLNRAGVEVVTADIDGRLGPDYVADVRTLPFAENSFDVVAAFQILEHLPFTDFATALGEMRRVSRRFICISLPDGGRYSRLNVRLTRNIGFDWIIDLSRIFKKEHVFDGQHYWEINKSGHYPEVVRHEIEMLHLNIVSEGRLPHNPYHRLFVLEKPTTT